MGGAFIGKASAFVALSLGSPELHLIYSSCSPEAGTTVQLSEMVIVVPFIG